MSDCVICGEGPLLLDEFYRCRVCRKKQLENRYTYTCRRCKQPFTTTVEHSMPDFTKCSDCMVEDIMRYADTFGVD